MILKLQSFVTTPAHVNPKTQHRRYYDLVHISKDDEKTKGGDGDGGDGEVSEERDELAGVLRAVVAADEGRDGRELREGVE